MMRDGPRSIHSWQPLERRPHCQTTFDPADTHAAFNRAELQGYTAGMFLLGVLVGIIIALLAVVS